MENIKAFPKKGKNKKWQLGDEEYKNSPEDEKQKLVEYRRKHKTGKSKNTSQIKTDWCFIIIKNVSERSFLTFSASIRNWF